MPIVALQNEILRRAVSLHLDRRAIRLTTAEDLILLKMVFRRSKDIDDIRGMLYAQRENLDLKYIEKWAGSMLDDSARTQLDELIAQYVQA